MNGETPSGALLERLQHEHHELNRRLLNIKAELVASAFEADMAQSAAAVHLAELAAELKTHFAEEEEGGCFEEAVCRCPSLTAEVHRLIAEHPQLSAEIEDLLEDIKDGRCSHNRLIDEFDRFSRKLKIHEASETRLLQMALGSEASEYDVEGNE